ncbi:MAG: succinate dehydrogenase flavoprotein subunit [Phycisphaerales bacterium]|nr:succinate dehydrogenase flavoprotein subunit [Phycisphaerales bacterium]
MARQRVVIIGGGLAGLAAAMQLAEDDVQVDLISMVPVKRSHSVCAQGGINCVNKFTRAQGDTEWNHFDDSVYGGEFLNNQPPVKEMCDWAPRIVDLSDRLGVPFNRSGEGNLAVRRFGGTLFKRTVYAGASTGQQLLYALDEQVRRWEVEGRIQKYEFWEFLGPILDDQGVCRGCVAQDMFSLEVRAFPGDALILATGGCGLVYGKSTMSMVCTGGANARAYKAGVSYANGEFVQVHPTAIPGADKLRLISEAARGESGRVWVPRNKGDHRPPNQIAEHERYYFLEERYPTYGNLVPRDIATREIFAICKEGYSVNPSTFAVYLDLTERATGIKAHVLRKKLGNILEIYEKFRGVDPLMEPMQIFPAVHYSMGGLWVDFEKHSQTGGLRLESPRNQQTNVPGLFAIGEADYQYHGANRLGANSLLSCVFAGLIMGPALRSFLGNLPGGSVDQVPGRLFEQETARHKQEFEGLLKKDGPENAYEIHRELGELMTRNVTVVRRNDELRQTLDELAKLRERFGRCGLSDHGTWTNQTLSFTRALGDMLLLARVITTGALLRDECRGAHYKPECAIPAPTAESSDELRKQARTWCEKYQRQNQEWLKTTLARYTPGSDDPQITYEPVDTTLIPPRPRTYGLKGAGIIDQVWKESFTTPAGQPASPGAAAS